MLHRIIRKENMIPASLYTRDTEVLQGYSYDFFQSEVSL